MENQHRKSVTTEYTTKLLRFLTTSVGAACEENKASQMRRSNLNTPGLLNHWLSAVAGVINLLEATGIILHFLDALQRVTCQVHNRNM